MNNCAPGLARVAVTFALPDESRAFTARLTNREVMRKGDRLPLVRGCCGDWEVLVVHTGVGDSASCRSRLDAVLHSGQNGFGRPGLLISSGYAGALRPGMSVGDLVLAENVSDPELAAKASRILGARGSLHRGSLTTQPSVAETPASKSALARATGADAVDMETGWIASACARADVAMLSLRVISDAAGQAFPAPGAVLFDIARQRPRYAALPLWLLAHPWRIGPFVRFVRGLGPAQERLAAALQCLLEELPCASGSENPAGG